MRDVVIVSDVRTAIGSFMGTLSNPPATLSLMVNLLAEEGYSFLFAAWCSGV